MGKLLFACPFCFSLNNSDIFKSCSGGSETQNEAWFSQSTLHFDFKQLIKGNEYCLKILLHFWSEVCPTLPSFTHLDGKVRPSEPEGLFVHPNCLSAPFYRVFKSAWLCILLNDVWINACSYMQLGGAVQGITDRSSIKQSFYRSVCICGVKWCCQTMHVLVHWMMCLQWVNIRFAAVLLDSVACMRVQLRLRSCS